jgi:prephenate dehydratase
MPPARIAIQGEFGSFSHEAALSVASEATIVPCALSAEVFAKVVAGEVDAAVIPIENSLAGSVVEHYDLLFSEPVRIVEESLLRIRHMLIAPSGLEVDLKVEQVRRVYSHPVALAQCRRFFQTHPQAEAVPFYDTAGSVKHLAAHPEPGAAAIAGREAARVYNARVLVSGIEDNQENYTRFFRVEPSGEGNAAPRPAEAGKVSLAFVVDNRPGTLVAALEVFAGLGLNLTRLESRPIPGKPWEYVFYADCDLPPGQTPDRALALLKQHCSVVKELGRYAPAGLPAHPSPESRI